MIGRKKKQDEPQVEKKVVERLDEAVTAEVKPSTRKRPVVIITPTGAYVTHTR